MNTIYHNEPIIIGRKGVNSYLFYVNRISQLSQQHRRLLKEFESEYSICADDLVIDDLNGNQMCIYALIKKSKYFVFPQWGGQYGYPRPIIEIEKSDRVFFISNGSHEYVCIERNNHIEIKKLDGTDIVTIDEIKDTDSEYPLLIRDKRYNYFSYAEGRVLSSEWFEDAKTYDEKNNIFEVKRFSAWEKFSYIDELAYTIISQKDRTVSVKAVFYKKEIANIKNTVTISGVDYCVISIWWVLFIHFLVIQTDITL